MSHYRERRDKIKNLQSKSLDHLASGAASKPPSDEHQPGPLEQSQSQRRLREASPRWKEHYAKLSQQWSSGISLAQEESNVVWEDIRQRKEKGGYPWTHLSHHQDEEVWLKPEKLPQDIGSVTMLRKDNTIPKEWFHLPKGAEVPTVDDLLRNSSPEIDITDEEELARRAKSPPLCGRSRSKSRERVAHKHQGSSTIGLHQRPQTPLSYDTSSTTNITPVASVYSLPHAADQTDKLEDNENFTKQNVPHTQKLSVPVSFKPDDSLHKMSSDTKEGEAIPLLHDNNKGEAEKYSDSDSSTSCFPVLRKSRSRSKSKERKLNKDKLKKKAQPFEGDNGHQIHRKNEPCDNTLLNEGPQLLPKSGSGNSQSAPKVDRSCKPNTPPKSPTSSDEADGYEPVNDGKKPHKDETIDEQLPYADSRPSFKDRFPRFHRDHSKASKRDSSKGSGYEPVGWENDNLTRSNINDSKDELGSKLYEDLDENIGDITQKANSGLCVPYDKIEHTQEKTQEEQAIEKEASVQLPKDEPEEQVKAINGHGEVEHSLMEVPDERIIHKYEELGNIITQEKVQVDEEKQMKENVEMKNENVQREEKEKKRLAKEEKEKDERLKKEQKAREEEEAKEKKQREKMERERVEIEAREQKRIAKEQKEKEERSKRQKRKAKELEEKERKLKDKMEKERLDKEQKEKKRQEKEAKESEQRILKERKEAEEREARERRAREKREKENREKREQEKNKLSKELNEKQEQIDKEKIEEKGAMNEEEKNGGNVALKDNTEKSIGIQNYNSQEAAPSMIEKERLFDEENSMRIEDVKSPNFNEICADVTGYDEQTHSQPYIVPMSEYTTNEQSPQSKNKLTEKEGHKKESKENVEDDIEALNVSPLELDETDFINKASPNNTNTESVKDSEGKPHLSQQTEDSVSFSSLPSDSQITEDNNSKSNTASKPILTDDVISTNINQHQEEIIEFVEKPEEENTVVDHVILSDQQDVGIPHGLSKDLEDKNLLHLNAADQEDDADILQIKQQKENENDKEDVEMKKQRDDEEKGNNREEKESLRLQKELNLQKQNELKERWDGQDKEDTLKRKLKLKEAGQKTNEEREISRRLKEENEKRKAEENEAKLLIDNKLKQQQIELKEKFDDQEKENTLKRKAKAEENASKSREKIEMNRQVKEDEEKRKLQEKEKLKLKNKKVSEHQQEMKKRWVEHDEDEKFYKQSKKQEVIRKKQEGKEMKKQQKEEAEKRRLEEKEAVKLAEERNKERQKYLKQKWIEQESQRNNDKKDITAPTNESKSTRAQTPAVDVNPDMKEETGEDNQEEDDIKHQEIDVGTEPTPKFTGNLETNKMIEPIVIETHPPLDCVTMEPSQKQEGTALVNNDCPMEENGIIDSSFEKKPNKVVWHSEDDIVGDENKTTPVNEYEEKTDDTKNEPPLVTEDSEELRLLLQMLQKNTDSVCHFTTPDESKPKETLEEVPDESEDPEELKLLIQMLSEKHLPMETVPSVEHIDSALQIGEEDKHEPRLEVIEKVAQSEQILEIKDNIGGMDDDKKLKGTEVKTVDEQTKIHAEELKEEKQKKDSLKREEEKRIKKERKLEEDKCKKEKDRQAQLAAQEKQEVLKEKWNIQEQERIDNKNEINTRLQGDEENKKTEEKENLAFKTKEKLEHQKELKKRWVEYDEDETFYNETKKKDEINKRCDEKQSKKEQTDDEKKRTKKEKFGENAEISPIHCSTEACLLPQENDLPEMRISESDHSNDEDKQDEEGGLVAEENLITERLNVLNDKEDKTVEKAEEFQNKLEIKRLENDSDMDIRSPTDEEKKIENNTKLNDKKLKEEEEKLEKLANAEEKLIEKQRKLEIKRHQQELEMQEKTRNTEKQKELKEKWIKQEEQRKRNKTNKIRDKKEREKIEKTSIRIIEYPERVKGDPIEKEVAEKTSPLLVEYAESVSSDIIKEAKHNNVLESTDEVCDSTGDIAKHAVEVKDTPLKPEMVMQESPQKSSTDEGLLPILHISEENLQQKDTIPVIPHSDVERILQIIKETDEEFREKERQIIDEIERKRKEENIKEMEKELKKQKRDQERIRKENEKAQKKREKLEKEALLKKEKEDKKNKKLMDAKLREENKADVVRPENESKEEMPIPSEVDSGHKPIINKETQLALEEEMRQYNVTPEVEEEITDALDSKILCNAHRQEGTESVETEGVENEIENPFESKQTVDENLTKDEEMDERGTTVPHFGTNVKDEPKHVTWMEKNVKSSSKELQPSTVDAKPEIKTEKSFFETKLERPSFFKTKKQTSSQLPKVPSPVPSKEVFLTQPDETDSRSTSVMATSLAGPRSDDIDEFARYAVGNPQQNGGGVSPDGIEHDYGYEEDEMDFTPQNGYIADEPDFVPYHEEEPKPTKEKAPKERKSREPMKMPTVDIKGKLDSMKNMKLPSAHDVAESFNPMNSLKRPLGVRVREEDPAVQRERALIVKNSTPGELGNLRHPLDIPMPKYRSRNKSAEATAKKAPKVEENGKESEKEDTSTPGKGKLFNTLPRSLRQQNLVTSQREMDDPKVLEERKELIKNYTPAELAQIRGISDFPVPSKITNMMEKLEKGPKRAPSADQEKPAGEANEPWTLYGTLPRSMRETKLQTNTREMLDPKELEMRQELIRSKSPAELAQIHGFGDIPVPTKIQNVFKTRSRSGSLSKMKRTRSESLGKRSGSMTFTLPKSWRETKLLTGVKVEEDEAVLAQRRNLTETKTPNELSQITSIGDLPIPSALENFWKSDKKPRDASQEDAGSPIRINLNSMYDNLPRSLTQQQLLVKTKVEEDPEVLKRRQEMVATKKPAELAQIGGLSDFPVPTGVENILNTMTGKAPTAPQRKSREDREGKRKRNFTTGGILSYDNLPEGLKTQLLVKTKVTEDLEVLAARQELTRTKTPNELGQIHGFGEFPLPEKIDTLVRPSKRNLKSTKEKQEEKKRSVSLSSLSGKISRASLPDSMTQQLLVKARREDPEVQRERQEIVNTKTVSELGQIHGLSDFPVPATLERLMDKNKRKSAIEPKSEDTRPLKDKMYDTLPKSMKTELLVKVRDEDPEIQKQRQELTRSKSPVELSQMSSISDFPVPTTFEKMLQKTSPPDGAPVPPPRRSRLENFNKDNLYEKFPSLNAQCMVASKVLEDEEVIKQRQELIRSKSPAELSQIHGLDDIPVPGFVEHSMDSLKRMSSRSRERKDGEERTSMYDKVPESLKTQLLVKSTVEDPEIQQQRADLVKTKTVSELSQVKSINDFPVPENIKNLRGAVERKKRFREKQRSLSAKNLNEMMPESLKSQLLVKSKIEKPEVQRKRAELVSSKSVSELSQVTSLSDFPIPTTLERMISKSKGDLTDGSSSQRASRFDLSKFKSENIYATLPKSLTEKQLLVKARMEDPEIQKSRKETTENKSVAELSQIHSMSDFPIPTTIETLIEKGRKSAQGQTDQPERSGFSSPTQMKENIYATLPRSLKSELAVTTKIQDPEVVQERREMVANKSVNELSQVTSLADVPIPSPIQKMIDTAQHLNDPKTEGDEQKKSRPSSRGPSYDIYASLPRSLKSELLVRNKVEEDAEELKRRRELVETKTPGELSQIHTLNEVPVPRRIEAWLHGTSGMDQQSSLPRNKQEIKDIVYKSILPESMTKPCVVRSRIEDPDVLLKRQEIQQQKSIHELSKIRNVNEFPLPLKLSDKLPDIPLPSFKAKNILKAIAPTAKNNSSRTKQQQEPYGEYTPASTPGTGDMLTDDEMLRYDTSTPGGDASHRAQDFGYELIDESTTGAPQHLQQIPAQFQDDILDHAAPQIAVDAPEEDSIAEQYRGTPPMKSKKKKPDRRSQSHEVSDHVQLGDELPPPLPPKRPSKSPMRDSPLASASQENDAKNENTNKNCYDIESPTIASTCLHEHVHTEVKDLTPNAPVRRKSPKTKVVSQTVLKPEPKIGFSYTNDPHNTPTRHTSSCRPEDIPFPKSEISQTQQQSQSDTILTVSKSSSSGRVPGGYVAQDDFLSCADDPVPQQLPGAPSSARSSVRHSGSGHSFASARSGVSNIPDQFHSVASTLHSGTLVDSNNGLRDDDENTLAESILDSMHSCADTMVTTGEDDAALHSCADTLAEASDDEIDFGDSPTPPIGSG